LGGPGWLISVLIERLHKLDGQTLEGWSKWKGNSTL